MLTCIIRVLKTPAKVWKQVFPGSRYLFPTPVGPVG